MSEPRKSRLLSRLLIAGMLLLAVTAVSLVGLFIASQRRPVGPVNTALHNRLIGTWVGDHGIVLEFRGDGTATSRSSKDDRHLMGLAWTVSGNELAIYMDTQNRINRYVFNEPVVCEEIVEITPEYLKLIDRSSPGNIPLHFRKMKAQANAP